MKNKIYLEELLGKYEGKDEQCDMKLPVLEAFVKRRLELRYFYEDEYIKKRYMGSRKGLDGEDEKWWANAWRNQYWHLFYSWASERRKKCPGKKDCEIEMRDPKCTELFIWLYEAQGLLDDKDKREKMIKKIEHLKEENFKNMKTGRRDARSVNKIIFQSFDFEPSMADLIKRLRELD